MHDCIHLNQFPPPFSHTLYWQNNLDAHVLSLMHNLAIDDNLMHTNTIVFSIRGVRRRCDLDFSPLLVSRYDRAFKCAFLEFLIYALLINAAFSLDQGRF